MAELPEERIMSELLDICTEDGLPTGRTEERRIVHRDGLLHRTAHVWIVCRKKGRDLILLQKRSQTKDSWPGMYDTSSAGHIPAGEEPLPSALRELREELGIKASAGDLVFAGSLRIRSDKEFYGHRHTDNEFVYVYVLEKDVSPEELVLQEDEVEEVRWFSLEEVKKACGEGSDVFCVPPESLSLLETWLRSGCRSSDRSHAG